MLLRSSTRSAFARASSIRFFSPFSLAFPLVSARSFSFNSSSETKKLFAKISTVSSALFASSSVTRALTVTLAVCVPSALAAVNVTSYEPFCASILQSVKTGSISVPSIVFQALGLALSVKKVFAELLMSDTGVSNPMSDTCFLETRKLFAAICTYDEAQSLGSSYSTSSNTLASTTADVPASVANLRAEA